MAENTVNFNPRAPCGARRAPDGRTDIEEAFQSTRPLRGATANVHKKYVHVCENRQKKLFSLPNAVCQSA